MKEKKYILGLISIGTLVLGAVFKVNHWPAAGIMITIGTLLVVFAFLPLALISNYRIEKNRANLPLYYTTWVTCLIVMSAMLFKIMHWPGAGILVVVSLPFPFVVFLPVYLYVTSKNKNYNMYNMVFVLFLLAVQAMFAALLALNVSRERIDDSLTFAADYNRVEEKIRPVVKDSGADDSKIVVDINATLKIIDECQDMLFTGIGVTEKTWEEDPFKVPYMDSRGYLANLLIYNNDNAPGIMLGKSLDNLFNDFKEMKGSGASYDTFASIINYQREEDDVNSWSETLFTDNYLSWVLIYLDELEVNLLFLKSVFI